MNISDLKNTWRTDTQSKIFILLSHFIGLFFLFSLVSKLLDISDWLYFNADLVDSSFGYINGILILAVECYFAFSFIFFKINNRLLILSLMFILFLTIFVMVNKNLFQTCMCFGKLISMKPDFFFVLKNSILLVIISIIYLIFNKMSNLKHQL
ncbi:MAG: MauE/DoxX family redox-associated membrane protein [Bacteroidales bacterium]